MLSFGSAAYTSDKKLVSTFSANLETLEGAAAHPKTAEWWATQPEAWAACRKDLQKPEAAMRAYVEWIKTLNGKPVFVAYPAGFDFLFVYWYLIRFVGESQVGCDSLRREQANVSAKCEPAMPLPPKCLASERRQLHPLVKLRLLCVRRQTDTRWTLPTVEASSGQKQAGASCGLRLGCRSSGFPQWRSNTRARSSVLPLLLRSACSALSTVAR